MKKIKNNFGLFFFFFLVGFIIFIFSYPSALPYDPLWNFQSIYKMANYGEIYNVNNVIHMPLYFELGKIFFKILGSNFSTYSILQFTLFFTESIVFYKLLRELKIKRLFSMLYLEIFLLFSYHLIVSDASYNVLAVIFTFLGIITYLKYYEEKKYHYLQGIFIFLTFFSKQTIGIYYVLGIVCFEFIDTGLSKKFFLNQIKKGCTFIPLLLFSFIIMYFKGNLFNFFNLSIGSILEFGSSNFLFVPNSYTYIVPMIIIMIFTIILSFKKNLIKQDEKRNITFLLSLSLFISFNMYPLINDYHTVISCTYFLILFLYEIHFTIVSELIKEKTIKIAIIILLLTLLILSIFKHFSNPNKLQQVSKDSIFYPAKLSEIALNNIDVLTNYIQDKRENNVKVIVLEHDAGLYMLPLGINNYEFDMLLSGNLGYNGIQKTINKISSMKNTEFLIFTDENNCFWQSPKEIREYITNNLEKSGEILDYSIYFNK